jgi:hypothetical protein
VRNRRITIITAAAAPLAAAAIAAGSAHAVLSPPPPVSKVSASTGVATNVLGTSALLTGAIDPHGLHVSYYFRWGPTVALGFQTPIAVDTKPEIRVRVGQPISGLQPGNSYRYRLVVVGPEGAKVEEHERVFTTRATPRSFVVPRSVQATYGRSFLLTGMLLGTGNAEQSIVLQASPFPYLESFAPIGPPATTTRSGAFSFRVGHLRTSTQLRLMATGLLPVFSPIIKALVQPDVTLHVRSSSQPGLVRLYGTISPAVHGAKVLIQVQKAVRPQGLSEVTERWATQFVTQTKKGIGNSSRFSVIVKIRHKGRYRVYVRMPKGPLVSGAAGRTYVLRAAPGAKG